MLIHPVTAPEILLSWRLKFFSSLTDCKHLNHSISKLVLDSLFHITIISILHVDWRVHQLSGSFISKLFIHPPILHFLLPSSITFLKSSYSPFHVLYPSSLTPLIPHSNQPCSVLEIMYKIGETVTCNYRHITYTDQTWVKPLSADTRIRALATVDHMKVHTGSMVKEHRKQGRYWVSSLLFYLLILDHQWFRDSLLIGCAKLGLVVEVKLVWEDGLIYYIWKTRTTVKRVYHMYK